MKPSESELRLLRRLWRKGRLSARELHDAVSDETGWSFSSTRKTLDRMVDKGLVAVEPVHGVKTFVPVQSKLATMAMLIRDFTRNVLEADAPMPAAAFTGSKLLDPDEVRELEDLLENLDAKDRS
ncbi:MAG: BlaI/MecI/CopY family transcriptional regulator [Pseudomonadota bacterium]